MKIFFGALILILLVSGALLRLSVQHVGARSVDEGVYNAYAKKVVQEGYVGGIRLLAERYRTNEKLWIYPPPTRIGYIYPLAAAMRLSGKEGLEVGVWVSFVFSMASLGILVLMGMRFFNPVMTLAALFFMVFSPLELVLAQRGWADGMLAFTALLLLYASFEIAGAPERKSSFILFILAGMGCMLTKEFGFIVFGLNAAGLFILFMARRQFRGGALFGLMCMVTGFAVLLFLSWLSGGAVIFMEMMRKTAGAIGTNAYAVKYQSGPWYVFLEAFWFMSPVTTFFAIAGFGGVYFLPEKIRPFFRGCAALFIFCVLIFMLIPFSKNLRYLSAVYPCFYWMAAAGFWFCLSRLKLLPKFLFVIIALSICLVIVGGAARDFGCFKFYFQENKIVDLTMGQFRDLKV